LNCGAAIPVWDTHHVEDAYMGVGIDGVRAARSMMALPGGYRW